MENVDLSENKKIDTKWWKFIFSSIFMLQGMEIKKILLKKCDLNEEKIKNFCVGIVVGMRRIFDVT